MPADFIARSMLVELTDSTEKSLNSINKINETITKLEPQIKELNTMDNQLKSIEDKISKNADGVQRALGETLKSATNAAKMKIDLETEISTKLDVSTYNTNNEKLNTYITKTVETKIDTLDELSEKVTALEKKDTELETKDTELSGKVTSLEEKDKTLETKDTELKAEIDKKVSTTTYNENNEKIHEWAESVNTKIETIYGRFKKKTMTNVKTNSGGAFNTGLTETTAIYLQGKCTVTTLTPSGAKKELLYLAPTISHTNHVIYIFPVQLYTTEEDGHHDVTLLGPSQSVGDLTIYYYDITGLTITEDATPASISDDDLFDEEFPI